MIESKIRLPAKTKPRRRAYVINPTPPRGRGGPATPEIWPCIPDQNLSSAMVRVTQCNTLVFLPELNSRENFPPGGGVGGSISAPNNDEFKHGAVVYGYIGAGY